ncbi:MAG: Holliday junction resolvase RecU [Lachnospiraceae bacterium]|jgi:recombination protein U|nr:Holliday junction resolvase RecU [Lachnospiraceae bacterium]MCH4027613.1 Holliday junction resolvase RecU [Lachnospiraceae bacterium]MCH4065453.1 Holliday junction resolvase RecU [Lachnospiraceae bacterium]MCH4111493.1 Holliday junction resolvase RecU [Lachnospiraceae bacterium]
MLHLSEKEAAQLIGKDKLKDAPSDTEKRIRAGNSLASGKAFENLISLACNRYRAEHAACIIKTPEPFAVFSRTKDGLFQGRFTNAKAQPDFHGILRDGRTIVFEAKSTAKDRIRQNVLTGTQKELLAEYASYGALSYVAAEISERYFMIPYDVWQNMKQKFGRLYLLSDEITEYEIIPETHNPLPFLSNIQRGQK